jgi:RND family efflux transporter MFP subunit
MKKVILFISLAIATGAGWYFFGPSHGRKSGEEVMGKRFLAKAEKRDIEASIDVTGDVAPDSQLDVRAEVGGKIKRLCVEPGNDVKAGDMLVEIDDRDLQTERKSALTQIEGARLSVDKTERNYKRSKDLFESKLVSREVYDNVKADFDLARNVFDKAQSSLQIVEDKLYKTQIFAPSGGTVLDVSVIEGQVVTGAGSVNAGTSIMKIADMSKMLVNSVVNQVDVMNVQVGKNVAITSDSIPGVKIEARISFVAPVATLRNSVKGFAIKSIITKTDPRIRPGMTVTLTIPSASARDVVSVPISAVFKDKGDSRVVYVRRGGATERRDVKVGVSNYDYAEIKSGVQAGEEVMIVDPTTLSNKT